MLGGTGGSTALQRMLGNYNEAKRSAVPEVTQTPLSGIGMWNKQGEDKLREGLTDAMTGNMKVENSAKLGSAFGKKSNNPWEAFIATPAEQQSQMENQNGSLMSAYSPQARGINMDLW